MSLGSRKLLRFPERTVYRVSLTTVWSVARLMEESDNIWLFRVNRGLT